MEEDAVFITKLNIGSFIILVTLVSEFLVFPLFEILKNRLTNAIAIYKVANTQSIVLRSDRWWSHLLGVSDNVKCASPSFRISYFIKVLFKGLVIGMLAYWEGSANEVTMVKHSSQRLAQGKDVLNGIRLMSPMPFTGLSENEIQQMVTFKPNGVTQNGKYAVLDGEKYTFPDDNACTSVTGGKLIIYLSRVEITDNEMTNTCLDGTEGKPTEVVAELNIQSRNQTVYALSTLNLQSEVSTDGLSIIYKVNSTYKGKDKVGYVALTRNSHENGNTEWSFYGILHDREGNYLEYLNIPISSSVDAPCDENPFGTWQFSEQKPWTTTCPDSTVINVPGGTVPEDTTPRHVIDARWVVPNSKIFQTVDRKLSELALQWVAETPFSQYVAKTKLAEEIWSRMNRQVYFVSDFREIIELPEPETVKYTQTSRKRATIMTATLCAVLLTLLLFLGAEKMQIRRHNITMNFCDIGSVLGMWMSEIYGEATCAVSTTSVTIGLTQSGDVGLQHIGMLNKLGESIRSAGGIAGRAKRDPNRPLV